MNEKFLTDAKLPFCKGCGHHFIANHTGNALDKLGLTPRDVIIVTDIGCHGIVDENFLTHTVHGLHGRAVALAAGISAGLNNPDKKVLVYLGDGGATIGLQHLLEAAHRNFNLTVILHNNFLYGMTGGQPSGLTPSGFNTPITVTGAQENGYDVCRLLHSLGASYVNRIVGIGDFSGHLAEAVAHDGFSLVEIVELCPSYAVKLNPNMKIPKVEEQFGIKTEKLTNPKRQPVEVTRHEGLPSLIDERHAIETKYAASLDKPFSVVVSGSAGEGVQSAAGFLAQAAVASGLQVTKKGSYPVTVGVGFSTAELILSPEPIQYTGIPNPDVVIVTSEDGLQYSRRLVEQMESGTLYLDESLEQPKTRAKTIRCDFRGVAGAKSSALYALFTLLSDFNVLPVDALVEAVESSKLAGKLNVELFLSKTVTA